VGSAQQALWAGPNARQEQPAIDMLAPPPQVMLAGPDTLQAPLQVMLQVPETQATLDPVPTLCVQDAPLHVTLQLGPQLPEQVAPDSQLSRQSELVQGSKLQLVFAGQSHALPEQ
jgi:hypothetical protein